MGDSSKKKRSKSKSKKTPKKLWINVPRPSETPATFAPSAKKPFVKPTATTLLRHHNTLARQEAKERSAAQNYAAGQFSYDVVGWRDKELEGQKQQAIEESKRILKAKLAYHKAKAAAEQNVTEKSAQAQNLRDKNKKLAEVAEVGRAAELERRRAMAAEIQGIHNNSRQMVERIQRLKQKSVHEARSQVQEMKAEAKRRDFEEFLSKKEKIAQIQASRQAAKVANGVAGQSTGNFISALGSPDTEIRLKLGKEAQEAAAEERRRRVAAMKGDREMKMKQIQERLERQLARTGNARALRMPFKTLPSFSHPPRDVADEEVEGLIQQLENFRSRGVDKNQSQQPENSATG